MDILPACHYIATLVSDSAYVSHVLLDSHAAGHHVHNVTDSCLLYPSKMLRDPAGSGGHCRLQSISTACPEEASGLAGRSIYHFLEWWNSSEVAERVTQHIPNGIVHKLDSHKDH